LFFGWLCHDVTVLAASSLAQDFIRNLKRDAVSVKVDIGNGDDESMEDVVTFDQDQDLSKFCQSLGLKRLPEQPSVKFLLRRDYFTLWQTIWLRYKASIPETKL
jgi:hypothetical protein